MSKYLTITTVLLGVMLAGCEGPKIIASQDAGTIVSANVVPTSFNESIKTTVDTTLGTFLVYGTFSAMKGSKVELVAYDNGRYRLCIKSGRCYRIGGM
jgi:hypothetical protein